MKRAVYETVGPLDERFGVGMFEDDDYNRRAREKGWADPMRARRLRAPLAEGVVSPDGREGVPRALRGEPKKYEEKWGEAGRPTASTSGTGRTRILRRAARRTCATAWRRAAAPSSSCRRSAGASRSCSGRTTSRGRLARDGYVAIFDCSNAHDDVNGFKEIEPNLFLFRGPDGLLDADPGSAALGVSLQLCTKRRLPRRRARVYDWIDDLEVFPYDRDLLDRNHARALEATASSRASRGELHEQALGRPARRRLTCRTASSSSASRTTRPPLPEDKELRAFRESGKPIAGYYGALAEWFDYTLCSRRSRASARTGTSS